MNERRFRFGRDAAGMTMIEVMVSLVLVSTILLVSLAASANLLRNDTQRRADHDGRGLANQIMDEVSAMSFQDSVDPRFGLEADEVAGDRSTFDDVDDYDRYSMSPPTYRDGTRIDGYADWKVSVQISPADPGVMGITTDSADPDSPLRRIVVNCTTPAGVSVSAATLVSNVPTNLPRTASYNRWQRIKLDFPNREIQVTAPLRNQPLP